jgi:hypothetical protein
MECVESVEPAMNDPLETLNELRDFLLQRADAWSCPAHFRSPELREILK